MEENIDNENEFGGIFDVSAESITTSEEAGGGGESDPDFYRASLKNPNVKDGVYKSKIRFVPNPLDKNLQKVSKWVYYLPEPGGESHFYVDCPSNAGSGGKFNILTTAFFMLKESDSKLMRNLSKKVFGRKRQHWSLIQIMLDVQDTENEGKIKIFRFGNQVNDLIEKEASTDASVGKKPVVVFHPFQGKDFILFIEEKQVDENQKMISYEKSYFDSNLTSISFDKGESRLEPTEENKKKIFNYLKENAPDLSKVAYKPWDEMTEQKVIEATKAAIADDVIFDKIYKKAYSKGKHTPVSSSSSKEEKKTEIKKDGVTSSPAVSGEAKALEQKITKKAVDTNQSNATNTTETTNDNGGTGKSDLDEFNFEDLPG